MFHTLVEAIGGSKSQYYYYKELDSIVRRIGKVLINVSSKKIILYIDEPIVELSSINLQKINELEKMGVEIVNSLEELKGVIE